MALSKTFKILNEKGLHIRPVADIVTATNAHAAAAFLSKNGVRASADSTLQILMLEAGQGDQVTVEVDGPDEAALFAILEEMFVTGFGEM